MNYSCTICNKELTIIHNVKDHTILCKDCISSASLYPQSICKTSFMLSYNDIKILKPVYLFKKINNNTPKLYLESHILNLLLTKYNESDNNNINTILNKKRENIIIRKNKKRDIENKRRKEIKEEFELNKLDYKEFGDVYMYITTGKPSIKEIIHNEVQKLEKENIKRIELSKYLKSIGIKYNEYNNDHIMYVKQKNETIKLSHFKPTNENKFIAHL